MNNLFVVVMGIGTVFAGLIAIIILCKIIGWCCQLGSKKQDNQDIGITDAPATPAPAAPARKVEIPNRRETVAAIAAAIAEDLGTDISAIRILSIERI